MMQRGALLKVLVIFVVGLLIGGGAIRLWEKQAVLHTVKIVNTGLSQQTLLPIVLAEQLGYFADAGLKV